MFRSLSPIPIYIKLYVNRIELSRLDNGKTISQDATIGFSNKRLVVADYSALMVDLKTVLSELVPDRFLGVFRPQLDVVIHQMELREGGLSSTEKRIIRDIAERIGGRKIIIEENESQLNLYDALRLLRA